MLSDFSLDSEFARKLQLELRSMISSAVMNASGDSILLSGGLDTSIVAAVASSQGSKIHGFTVILKDSPSPDLEFSSIVAEQFGIEQTILSVNLEDVEDSLPNVIRALRSFDPMEVRNSIVVFLGLLEARSRGFKKVLTGDAADELFAGYSFVFTLQKEVARETLDHLWEVMQFSSIPLAASLGIQATLPFLDNRVKNFAIKSVPFEFLVGKKPDDTSGQLFRKYILRKSFEDLLPELITWRTKTPIETGSGSTILPRIYSEQINDAEFSDKKKRFFQRDGVRIRDKEQLHYYEIYRGEFGPPVPEKAKRICPACTSNVPDRAIFCTTCGEFPI